VHGETEGEIAVFSSSDDDESTATGFITASMLAAKR
jgi:hypothetical protein